MFGIFVHYSTRPIYDVGMNLFRWPPSVAFLTFYPVFPEQILPKIINSDQTGFIKDRYIGKNIRLIGDIMDYTYQEYIIVIRF